MLRDECRSDHETSLVDLAPGLVADRIHDPQLGHTLPYATRMCTGSVRYCRVAVFPIARPLVQPTLVALCSVTISELGSVAPVTRLP